MDRIWVAILAVAVSACAAPTGWREINSDMSNTGTLITATQPASMATALPGVMPPIGTASPVIAPDGSIYLASWESGNGGSSGPGPWDLGHSAMYRYSGSTPRIMGTSGILPGQVSTAAIDAAGNVYATQFLSQGHGVPQSALLKWDSNLGNMKSAAINDAAVLSGPKILDGTAQAATLIVVDYINSLGANHVLILDDQLNQLTDWETCAPDQPSVWDFGFRVQGVDLGQPYPEGQSVGIRSIGNDTFLVAAGGGCGVTFYKIDPHTPGILTFIAHHGSSSWGVTSPSISADGVAVIADADHHVTAYDITTGDQKWQITTNAFVAATPVMTPGALNAVYVATYSEALEVELATGNILHHNNVTGTSTDATPAAGGNFLFVETDAGLFTFSSLDLTFVAAAPFKGGASSPAIGQDGSVVVPTQDAKLLRFPGP